MTWRDTLDLEILGGVAGQLKDFGGKVLKDGGKVDGSLGSDARFLAGDVAEMTLDTTTWELKSCAIRMRLGWLSSKVSTLSSGLATSLSFTSWHFDRCYLGYWINKSPCGMY